MPDSRPSWALFLRECPAAVYRMGGLLPQNLGGQLAYARRRISTRGAASKDQGASAAFSGESPSPSVWKGPLRGAAQGMPGGQIAATTFAPRDPHDRVQERLLAIHRIVYRSILPRDHSIVYRKGGACTLQSPGEVPCPSRCSWGGRRALNALVGGVGTPAQAPFVSPLLVGATRDQKSRGGGRP